MKSWKQFNHGKQLNFYLKSHDTRNFINWGLLSFFNTDQIAKINSFNSLSFSICSKFNHKSEYNHSVMFHPGVRLNDFIIHHCVDFTTIADFYSIVVFAFYIHKQYTCSITAAKLKVIKKKSVISHLIHGSLNYGPQLSYDWHRRIIQSWGWWQTER